MLQNKLKSPSEMEIKEQLGTGKAIVYWSTLLYELTTHNLVISLISIYWVLSL